jgi:hypothetical protein
MSKYVIEKGISPPEDKNKYPFHEMQVGDSFVAPREREESVRTAASKLSITLAPKRWTVRRNEDGIRVWRVA